MIITIVVLLITIINDHYNYYYYYYYYYYKDEIGVSILNICKTMAGRGSPRDNNSIPQGDELKGGVLVFFPSYVTMENLMERWKVNGIIDELKALVKSVIIEPKENIFTKDTTPIVTTKQKNDNFMSSSKITKQGGSDNADGDAMKGLIGSFESAISKFGGCVLLAVCR